MSSKIFNIGQIIAWSGTFLLLITKTPNNEEDFIRLLSIAGSMQMLGIGIMYYELMKRIKKAL